MQSTCSRQNSFSAQLKSRLNMTYSRSWFLDEFCSVQSSSVLLMKPVGWRVTLITDDAEEPSPDEAPENPQWLKPRGSCSSVRSGNPDDSRTSSCTNHDTISPYSTTTRFRVANPRRHGLQSENNKRSERRPFIRRSSEQKSAVQSQTHAG